MVLVSKEHGKYNNVLDPNKEWQQKGYVCCLHDGNGTHKKKVAKYTVHMIADAREKERDGGGTCYDLARKMTSYQTMISAPVPEEIQREPQPAAV